jgi:hypothetical protein
LLRGAPCPSAARAALCGSGSISRRFLRHLIVALDLVSLCRLAERPALGAKHLVVPLQLIVPTLESVKDPSSVPLLHFCPNLVDFLIFVFCYIFPLREPDLFRRNISEKYFYFSFFLCQLFPRCFNPISSTCTQLCRWPRIWLVDNKTLAPTLDSQPSYTSSHHILAKYVLTFQPASQEVDRTAPRHTGR